MIIRKLFPFFHFAWLLRLDTRAALPHKKKKQCNHTGILIVTCWIGLSILTKHAQIIFSPESYAAVSAPERIENQRIVTASFLTVFDLDLADSNRSVLRFVQSGETHFAIRDISGPSGAPIPVAITMPADAATPGRGYTFLMFRGVPEGIAFSAGFRLRNNWAVSLTDAQQLSLISPATFRGAFSMEVLLYRSTEAPPLAQRIKVEIRADKAPAPALAGAAAGPSPQLANTAAISAGVPRLPAPLAISPVEEKVMLTNGWGFVGNGNLASARFIFEDLAAKGSGAGAFALAQTYDPKFLKTVVVVGPQQANVEEARKWYRVAAERGDRNAQERLKSIENE
jgi:hypothetical protein